MIIGGLAGDAILIFFVPSSPTEKMHSALCSIIIAIGVWIEEVGGDAIERESDLKLAALEKKISPRVIDDDQAKEIIEKLKPFSETPFSIQSDPAADAAEYAFVNRMMEILQQAGWVWKSYSASLTTLPPGHGGIPNTDGAAVQIRINRSRYDDFNEPAFALASAVTNTLRASSGIVFDPPESPYACSPDTIHVEIYSYRA